jgi:hypothetical protein
MTALKRCYLRFNRIYFSNRLPTELPVRWAQDKSLGPPKWMGCSNSDFILLNARYRYSKNLCKTTLLHEMAHIATVEEKAHHGPQWKREMRRLARIGAFDNIW